MLSVRCNSLMLNRCISYPKGFIFISLTWAAIHVTTWIALNRNWKWERLLQTGMHRFHKCSLYSSEQPSFVNSFNVADIWIYIYQNYITAHRTCAIQIHCSYTGLWVISKSKGEPMTCLRRHRGETDVQLQPIRNPPLEGSRWSAPRSGRIILEEDTVSIVREGWCASWLVWTARKTSTPPWLDPWTVQSLCSHYTDYTIRAAM